MSACCGEPNCRRTQPMSLYAADFSGRVFLVTRSRLVKDRGDGTGTLAAVDRHNITPQMRRFIRANPEWVLGVLEARDDEEGQPNG